MLSALTVLSCSAASDGSAIADVLVLAGWNNAEPQSYEYVPGAGDDEESWAHGLTPALLFQHAEVSTLATQIFSRS